MRQRSGREAPVAADTMPRRRVRPEASTAPSTVDRYPSTATRVTPAGVPLRGTRGRASADARVVNQAPATAAASAAPLGCSHGFDPVPSRSPRHRKERAHGDEQVRVDAQVDTRFQINVDRSAWAECYPKRRFRIVGRPRPS